MVSDSFFLCSKIVNKVFFKLRHVQYGDNLVTRGIVYLCRSGSLQLGNNVTLQSSRWANPLGNRVVFEIKSGAKVTIGDNVGISGSVFKAESCIIIEDDVNIGAGCLIMDTDSHPIDYNDRISNRVDQTIVREVILRKGCFVGARCIITKGVEIGERSVIGAGSVVTKNVPADEVWAGNPAKFIKKIGV